MAQPVVAIVAHIREALHSSAIADIRALQVESDGDRVVLCGSVESFYHKQLAQELVCRFAGGIQVEIVVSVDYR